ncbi:SpoIIE family protein phosphatase [uncultured Rhodoblastus sp.]|uniref:SpoIIE family protein phosphatase n=1 Tax=uncultured Rhodoblastus sp. TaxID=543037 RepID=UPI0025E2B6EA|nr:SpoIIE family protein phosphatase [uncultured Rhodoblastus sp.]
MNEFTPAPPAPTTQKRRSIKTKILLALLTLSLLPLIIAVTINRVRMLEVEKYVKSRLVREAEKDLRRVAIRQAEKANNILDKIERQTRTVAFFTETVLQNPAALDTAPVRLLRDPVVGSSLVSPRLTLAEAKPELMLTAKLDKLFAFVKQNDSLLDSIFYGTKSGVLRRYPEPDEDKLGFTEFTLDASFAQSLNQAGEIAEPLWSALTASGVSLSPDAVASTTEPGKLWAIQDNRNKQIFSVRRDDARLLVKQEYDPTIRPWYIGAVNQKTIFWSKHPGWDHYAAGGKPLFMIAEEFKEQITEKVSPALAAAFRNRQIVLTVNDPISKEPGARWLLQDENGNSYEIRKDNDRLNVYHVDILTCSKAVLDAQGNLAGVVGLDITMETVGENVIRTPDEFRGDAFLLNGVGELVDQENAETFVPKANGHIRLKMVSGETGVEYDPDNATYVAFAPIRAVRTERGETTWSIGVSMPEREITQLAEDIHKRLVAVLQLVLGLFAALTALVAYAATRISKGITEPIVALDAGVRRIGGGDLDYRVKVETRDEIGELAGAFNKMAGDVKAYIKNLRDVTAEKERFESELQVARGIQMSFLKKIFPAFPNRKEFSLYAQIKPAREVGGDLYDFALLDDFRLCFYIGDVSDKGVPAALIMAMTMTLMKRASMQSGITPAGILSQVNVSLSEGNDNAMFVTLFIGILDLRTGALAFSNAGHNPPVILTAEGDCRFLPLPDGMVLGVDPETPYLDASVVLDPGATIVIYTDGVTEAMNPSRELYSEGRLQETLAGLKGCPVEDTVAAIFASVKAFASGAPQSDDIAVLAVLRK